MALQGMEARRQLRALADQFLGSERVQDLAAGLSGFVSGVSAEPGPPPSAGARSPADPWAAATSAEAPSAAGPPPGAGGGPSAAGGPAGFATGSADCCVCPVCRVIAALRDPSPELAERLATAAGDLAVGVSGLLRALGGVLSRPDGGTPHDPWRAATTAPPAASWSRPAAGAGGDAAAAAAAETAAGAGGDAAAAAAAETAAASETIAGTGNAAGQGGVAGPVGATGTGPAGTPAAKAAPAKKAVAKKAVAKKAVKKAARKPAAEPSGDGA
jgi:hypothetical protein